MTICPECKNEVSETDKICPKCGFPLKKVEQEDSKNNLRKLLNPKIIKLTSVVIACICVLIAISRVNNAGYKFCEEQYEKCMYEHNNNKITASYSSGMFAGSYRSISNSYKGLADSYMGRIWNYRIQAIISCGIGVAVFVFGTKYAKRKEKENGSN